MQLLRNGLWERRWKAVLLLTVFIPVLLFSTSLEERMIFDEIGYYSYFTSIVFDGDLDLTDDFDLLHQGLTDWNNFAFEQTLTGAQDNKFSIGPAIVWTPLFLLGHLLTLLARALGWMLPPDGSSVLYRIVIFGGAQALTLAAMLRFYLFEKEKGHARSAALALIVVFLGSFWSYYLLHEPLYPHVYSIAFSLLLLTEWRRLEGKTDSYPPLGIIAISALLVLLRWQNIILIAVLYLMRLWDQVRAWRTASPHPSISHCMKHALAWPVVAGFGFVPQTLIWWYQNGSIFTVPQGHDFLHWSDPNLREVLFSSWHGLFFSHPVLLLSLAGIVLGLLRRKREAIAFLLAFLPMLLLNAAVDDWWAGIAFGARRFDSLMPFFVLGMLELFERIQHRALRIWLGVSSGSLILVNLFMENIFSQRLLHPGLPWLQQTALMADMLQRWREIPSIIIPWSSPLGGLLYSGEIGVYAILRLLPSAVCLILLITGSWMTRRFQCLPRLAWLPRAAYPVGVVLVAGAIFIAGVRTPWRDLRILALAKAEFILGDLEGAQAHLELLGNSGTCEAAELSWRIAREREDRTSLLENTGRILNLCSSSGRLFVLLEGVDDDAYRNIQATLLQPMLEDAAWHPNRVDIYMTLGQAMQAQGRWDDALRLYRMAIAADPLEPAPLFFQAWIQRARGEREAALATLASVEGYYRVLAEAEIGAILLFQDAGHDIGAAFMEAYRLEVGDFELLLPLADVAQAMDAAYWSDIGYTRVVQARPAKSLGHWYPKISINMGAGLLGIIENDAMSLSTIERQAAMYVLQRPLETYLGYAHLAVARAAFSNAQVLGTRDSLRMALYELLAWSDIRAGALQLEMDFVNSLLAEGVTPLTPSLLLSAGDHIHPRNSYHPVPSFLNLAQSTLDDLHTQRAEVQNLQTRLTTLQEQLDSGSGDVDDHFVREIARILHDLNEYVYWWTPSSIADAVAGVLTASRSVGLESQAMDRVQTFYGERKLEPAALMALAESDEPRLQALAAKGLQDVVLAHPGDYWALLEYGRLLRRMAQYDDAVEVLLQAVDLAPGFAIGYHELSLTYDAMGDEDLAAVMRALAREVEPGWYALYGTDD